MPTWIHFFKHNTTCNIKNWHWEAVINSTIFNKSRFNSKFLVYIFHYWHGCHLGAMLCGPSVLNFLKDTEKSTSMCNLIFSILLPVFWKLRGQIIEWICLCTFLSVPIWTYIDKLVWFWYPGEEKKRWRHWRCWYHHTRGLPKITAQIILRKEKEVRLFSHFWPFYNFSMPVFPCC